MRQALVAVALAWLWAPVAASQGEGVATGGLEARRPRLALALSGGGARGIAHVGALRALEEAGLPVDAVAGNSMGAIVGGIYATGCGASELERIVRSLDWELLSNDVPDRRALQVVRRRDRYGDWFGVALDRRRLRLPAGLLAEHGINRFLIQHLSPAGYAASGDFDRLPIAFRAVATDLASGERVILSRGDLARAVRASMSIPVFFAPVEWEGRRLVDGLVVDNLPIDVARAFEADVTVAIDVRSPRVGVEERLTPLGVAAQVSDLLTARRNQDFSAEADVHVRPDLGRHSATDYSGVDTLIRAGYEATRGALPEIRARLQAAGVVDLAPRSSPIPGRVLEGERLAEVIVRGTERTSERLLLRSFDLPAGREYRTEHGLRAFDQVEATDLLEHVWMEFEPTPEGVRIVLRAKEAAPARASFGLGYSEWEGARGSVRLGVLNSLGLGEQVELLLAASSAEALAEASLRGDRLLVTGLGYRVSAVLQADQPRFFDASGEELQRAEFLRTGAGLALQASFERWGLLEAGVGFGRVETHAQAGLSLTEANDTVGQVFTSLTLDSLDDLLWPSAGGRLVARAEWSLDGLGASHSYWRLRCEGRLGRRLGRAALQLDGLLAASGGEVPVYDHFRLGGPVLVPGYRFEELKGRQAVAAALSLRYRIAGSFQVLARAGAGNVFDDRQQLGLKDPRWGTGIGVYYPSRVGPISLELGVREGGASLLSLAVGWH